jgi:hypothetical protein
MAGKEAFTAFGDRRGPAPAPSPTATVRDRAAAVHRTRLDRRHQAVLRVVRDRHASSSSRTTITGATGPKISSRNAGIDVVTPARTVGS